MPATGPDAIIWGVDGNGRRFRPGDWAERLAGLTSAFGEDQRVVYSPLVRPVEVAATTAVIVARALEALEPRFWEFLLRFAADNQLVVTHVDGAAAGAPILPPRVVAPTTGEPREPV